MGIYPAITPDHDAMFISLSLPNLCPRGPGFWKFNTLLNAEQYVNRVCDTYSQEHNYYIMLCLMKGMIAIC